MSASMQDLMSEVYMDGTNVLVDRKRGIRSARVTDGLKPKPVARQEGLALLAPEQLLNVHVATITLNGRVMGYQRELDIRHARKGAQALRDGVPFPVVELALDGKGTLWVVDGQHRIAAAIIARFPLRAVITRMDKDTQTKLFHSQRRAKTVDPNVLVLAGTGPFEKYIREAVEEKDHSWNAIVAPSRKSKTRISPWQMHGLLVRYVANRLGTGAGMKAGLGHRWDRGLADQLAGLIACFGNKKTNPMAFRPSNLSALGTVATLVFRRHEHPHPDDHERWLSHMAKFPWDHYMFIRTEQDMVNALLGHWNKRLRGRRRVVRD